MNFSLRRTKDPEYEPVTVDEVKLHTHIDHDVEDFLIWRWIKTAREKAEIRQRRSYHLQEWELAFDSWPGLPIIIPRPPLVSIDSVLYYDYLNTEYEFDTDNLIIDISSEPGRIDLIFGAVWPSVTLRSISAVKIAFTSGNSDMANVSQRVKDAIILYCAWQNDNRTGEEEMPKHIYDLLDIDRIHYP
jgi:uncharacterized phiE125 gp8 family phage protein